MRRLVVFGVVPALVAGCGGTKTTTVTVTRTETVTRTVTTTVTPTAVRLYFMRGDKLGAVARQVTSTARSALLAELNDGPSEEEKRLGFAAGQVDEERTAQIVYTLSQFDPAKPVALAGKRYKRGDFEELTPAILVETPLPFDAVSAPMRLTGTANTFEATFEYDVLDPAGKVLSHDFVTATSGSGTRGTFDVRVPFEAPNGIAKLVVYERSAADGSKTHVVEIPLSLAK